MGITKGSEMKLYEITDNMRELQGIADSGEMSYDDIADTMEALNISFAQKAEAALKVRQSMIGEVAIIDAEIARLTKLKEAPENNALRIFEYVKGSMLAAGKDKADLGIFKVTLKKASEKLGAIDETVIPTKYFTVVPAVPKSLKLDKKALLKAAKESSINGVELIDSERALIIK